MSTGLDQLQLDDLKLNFFNVDAALVQPAAGTETEATTEEVRQFTFGPSKEQLKSFDNWEGSDGKFFFPHNRRSKLGKVSDFVTAAIVRAKEQEREAERAAKERDDAQKRKDKKGRAPREERKNANDDAEVINEEDEDGFTIQGEGRSGIHKKQQQNPRHERGQHDNRRGGHNWNQRGANPSKAASAFGQEGGAGKRVYVQGVSRRQ